MFEKCIDPVTRPIYNIYIYRESEEGIEFYSPFEREKNVKRAEENFSYNILPPPVEC